MFSWQTAIIISHRYLGIAISLVFILWFASGVVIIYTGGMPSLTEAERLQHQPDLDLTQIRLTPRQAQLVSSSESNPKLLMIMGRPAYQFAGRQLRTVFADDGTVLSSDMISSRQIAADFLATNVNLVERVGRIEEVDQWTIGLRGQLPLEKFSAGDKDGTEIYVSPERGQVVLSTTKNDRILAWLGAIPHWMYFVDLRKRTGLWTDTVIWLASLGTLLATFGLILLFTQWRSVRPFRFSKAIPYQGLMRWHYLCGMLFGLITLTWVFSGLLSMEPYAWTTARGLAISREVFAGGDIELQAFAQLNNAQAQRQLQRLADGQDIKEIEFKRIQGDHYYQVTIGSSDSHWGFENILVSAEALQLRRDLFPTDYMTSHLQAAVSNFELVFSDVLDEYDNYYYSRPTAAGPVAPLPLLRVTFNDPAATRYYVDLKTSELVYQSHRLGRLKRWLYNGLHSLDFGFWYARRPLWDIVVIVLLLGGLMLCSIGCYLGIRRLLKNSKQLLGRS